MVYICINDLSLSGITLIEKKTNYQINYKIIDDIVIKGIFLKIRGKCIEKENEYKIILEEDENLIKIDNYLEENIPEYNSFISNENNSKYIEIKKNPLVDKNKLLKQTNYHLNIKSFNKYNNTCHIVII
jgi:hypothetical protein